MFFGEGYLSVESAQVVADSFKHLMTPEGIDQFVVVHVTDAKESELIELVVRPIELSAVAFNENANRTEMVQCITDKGDRITIVLPPPNDRQTAMALILIPEEGLQA